MLTVHDNENTSNNIFRIQSDTALIPPKDREGYWNEIIKKNIISLDCKAESGSQFLCNIHGSSTNVGSVTNIKVERKLFVTRTSKSVTQCNDNAFILNLILNGCMSVEQSSNYSVLYKNDFAICTASQPYSLVIPEYMEVACFRLPIKLEHGYNSIINRLLAVKINSCSGIAPLVRVYALELHKQKKDISQHSFDIAITQLSYLVNSLINECLGVTDKLQPTNHKERLQSRINAIISAELQNPQLNVEFIASKLNLSTRYLQYLWKDEGDTLSGFIRRKRLEKVAVTLKTCRHLSITEIALSMGFSNSSHFIKVFREHFGETPKDFRNKIWI